VTISHIEETSGRCIEVITRATRVIPKKLTGAINTLISDTERKRVWAKLRRDKTGPRGDEIPIPMPHDN